MSNPWREVFDEVRFSNGNTYDYHQQLSEEDSAIDSAKVQRAVFVIKRLAKEQGIRLPVAMTSYFSSHNDIPPAERAAIRAKLMTEDVEYIEEDPQAIGRGYTAADRSMAQSLGRAQQEQQRRDAARNAQKQTQQKLTTGGSSAQYQSNSYQPEGDELQEKITASTSVKTIIDDFIKSKDRRLAGRTKKERIKAALAASYQAKRKANEEVENFFEEKYGEKYEKKYGPSTGKNTVGNLDGDDQPNEPDSHEYAGVKDRAIKNAIKKRMKSESSDWRADLGFFTEKRHPESPRVETMPSEPSMSFTQGSKEKAANKRMKPKSSQMEEDFTILSNSLGGKLISVTEGRLNIGGVRVAVDELGQLVKIATKERPQIKGLTFAEPPAPNQALELTPGRPPKQKLDLTFAEPTASRQTPGRPSKQPLDLTPKSEVQAKPSTSTLTSPPKVNLNRVTVSQPKDTSVSSRRGKIKRNGGAPVESPKNNTQRQGTEKVKVSDTTKSKADTPKPPDGASPSPENQPKKKKLPDFSLPRGGVGNIYVAQSL